MIDLERKHIDLYVYTPWEPGENEWFLGLSLFRKNWEFGLMRDGYEDGKDMVFSRYYLYAHKLVIDGPRFEFPRKNRWTHVAK